MKMMTIYNGWWRESRLGGKAMLVLSAYQHGLTHSITSYVRVIWYPRIYTHRQQQQQHPHNSNRLIHKLFLFLLSKTFSLLLLRSHFVFIPFATCSFRSLQFKFSFFEMEKLNMMRCSRLVLSCSRERKKIFIYSSYDIAAIK